MAATSVHPSVTTWLAAGVTHDINPEQLQQELLGAWLDLDRVVIDDDVLVLRGRRDRGPDRSGHRRIGRFGWTASITGVHGILIKDRKRLGGLTVAEVRVSFHRLVLASSDGSSATIERFQTISYEPGARLLPRWERLVPMLDETTGRIAS
jgi:hypothetical protein